MCVLNGGCSVAEGEEEGADSLDLMGEICTLRQTFMCWLGLGGEIRKEKKRKENSVPTLRV